MAAAPPASVVKLSLSDVLGWFPAITVEERVTIITKWQRAMQRNERSYTLHSAIKVLSELMLLCKAFMRRLAICENTFNTFARLWTNISKIPHQSPQQFRSQPSVGAVCLRVNSPRAAPCPLLRGETMRRLCFRQIELCMQRPLPLFRGLVVVQRSGPLPRRLGLQRGED
jgi:hypothetical protein